eukprot:CAMPEP_0171128144 /NCGR_PEP_ID=MMETSP0766_2-20121228/116501_1 /TAXON_ID=439317 /ORGANISM="Gambierdiscus australes, Strain CAWD 149" /LENGTH=51 /DNA_ID=CAMNT_0011591289 /DNA_START=297 /DNA_END=449 /DNA_ORIENTATION=-
MVAATSASRLPRSATLASAMTAFCRTATCLSASRVLTAANARASPFSAMCA